jgi:hypothetical protein
MRGYITEGDDAAVLALLTFAVLLVVLIIGGLYVAYRLMAG